MKYANLHLHSIYSDGTLTPRQLFLIGKGLEYRALALTDHETDGGYGELKDVADKEGGVEVIPGIEFYGSFEGYHLHLTALDYDMDNPALRALVRERCEKRYECTKARFLLGVKNGFIEGLTWDDVDRYVKPGSWVHISSIVRACEMMDIPVPKDIAKNVFKTPEAEALGPAAPTAGEVIKAVRGAGGVITLAHPVKWLHLVPALVELGLNGIETSHPDLNETVTEGALAAAEKYNLYHLGGTDHSGAMSGMGGKHARPVFSGITEEEYFCLKERRKG